MHRHKYSIALVNYLNAKPFLYGLENFPDRTTDFDIQLLNPADCAQAFLTGRVDIALVPAGSLHELKDYKIITKYGIAADEEVRTVCLFSNSPPESWNEVFQDDHSKTSVLLSKLLIKEVFFKQPKYSRISVADIQLEDGQAVLMIGDKVFQHEGRYKYVYDLATLWKQWTGLPFVFAVWVARNEIPEVIEYDLNTIFDFGISHLDEVIVQNNMDNSILRQYYKQNIQYQLNDSYQKGLQKFLTLSSSLVHSEK